MKFTTEWVADWVQLDGDAQALAARLTMAGLEVDAAQPAAPLVPARVVRIEAIAPHPEAAQLRVCEVRVDPDRPTVQVVCGAPNARAGLVAPYVAPGTALPDGREIAVATLRGVASSGMLCSAAELGISDDDAGLLELPADAPIGSLLPDYLHLQDTVIELGLTPNRGDCLSILGIAREIAVLTGAPLRAAEVAPVPAASDASLPVRLAAPEACSRYAGRVIRGVSPATQTPIWMVERLRRCGVRSINVVVDITNYVMLELGQPMHAFDLAKLHDGIAVRFAQAGEALTLLDGTTLTLDEKSLVIADHAHAVALAGVMGGLDSSVTDATVDILLESAWFEPVQLARTARHFGLHTDAAHRFERGVDPAGQARAIERATELLLSCCGGVPGPVIDEVDPCHPRQHAVIEFRPERIRTLLGLDLAPEVARDILERLGLAVRAIGANWQVTVPTWRPDVTREVDLLEEIARIHGYSELPATLPQGAMRLALPDAGERLKQARRALVERGYCEAITFSFIADALAEAFAPDKSPIRLANPIASDMAVMRPSLVPGLLLSLKANRNRQQADVRLFESGLLFRRSQDDLQQEPALAGVVAGRALPEQWGERSRAADFFDLKQDVRAVLVALGQSGISYEASSEPTLHPGQQAGVSVAGKRVGVLGALHPRVARLVGLDGAPLVFEIDLEALAPARTPAFRPLSRFPAVRRDLAVVVNENVAAGQVLGIVRGAAGEHLKDLQLFDVYRGQGIDAMKKSLALGLLFQAPSSTLVDAEIEQSVAAVMAALAREVGGALR